MAVAESEVIRLIRSFKRAIEADEISQMALLADKYLDMELSLNESIVALAESITSLEDLGRRTYWQMQKLETFQGFQIKLLAALDDYNVWVAENIREQQLRLFDLGERQARAAVDAVVRGYSVKLTAAERNRIIAMVGNAGDGTPLASLLAKSGDFIRAKVTQELLKAVARAQNPRLTAQAIRKATGMSLSRAMSIAKTEQFRVYRETTLGNYRSAGIQYYQRLAARDPATCLACLSQDGEIYTTEVSVDDHVGGRCTCVPLISGADNPEMEPAQSWFDRQPESTKLAMMGPGRYDLYKSGAASWKDLAVHKTDPVWGGAWVPTPVSDLAGKMSAVA
jgi:SPP1 gp7 family putative phage head morphogenesis protein